MNLVLIGLRGTGKTTVARLVAERLQWPWVDADAEIEARAGKSIAQIFADQNETAFRDWESRVVCELATRGHWVLALGGGAVVRPENRAALQAHGRIVWLTAPPEVLWQRIAADTATAARRPNLTAAGGLAEIEALARARHAVYQECADHTEDTATRNPSDVAESILAWLKSTGLLQTGDARE